MTGLFRKLIQWLGLALIFFITLEFCARIDGKFKYDAPFTGNYSPSILRGYDKEGIPHNIPEVRFEKWENDSLGFRGPEITVQKPDGFIRIACMGTSESYGLYEQAGHEWPSLLTKNLSDKPNYQVINASIVGLPLTRYQAYLNKYVYKTSPDIMILVVNPWVFSVEVLRSKKEHANSYSTGPKLLYSDILPIRDLAGNPRIVPKMMQALRGFLPANLVRKYQGYASNKQIETEEKNRLNGKVPIDTIPQTCLTAYKSAMESLIDSLEQRNIRVILVTYPTLMDEENLYQYPELARRRFVTEFSLKGMLDVAKNIEKLTEEIAISDSIGFIPLNSRIPKTREFFADNVHFTDKGAELVANELASYIRNNY
jgi:lysophospholipase L1-like esterase